VTLALHNNTSLSDEVNNEISRTLTVQVTLALHNNMSLSDEVNNEISRTLTVQVTLALHNNMSLSFMLLQLIQPHTTTQLHQIRLMLWSQVQY